MAISCNRLRFRRGIPVIHHCTARFPRRFAPRNDKPVCPAPMNLCCKTYSLQGAQGTPLQTQSVHTVLSTHCTNCKCSAGSGMPFPATRHEGLASNENIRLTAAHLMLYTDTGGPQPVRLQENPPSQKFRREEKCERAAPAKRPGSTRPASSMTTTRPPAVPSSSSRSSRTAVPRTASSSCPART